MLFRHTTDMPCITWIDNYSKIYGDRLYRGTSQAYKSHLWTAVGYRPLTLTNVSAETVAQIERPLPPSLFMYKDTILSLVNSLGESGKLEDFHCQRLQLFTLPIGPDPRLSPEAQDFWRTRKDTSMKTFSPGHIWPLNCGSNSGLMEIVNEKLLEIRTAWFVVDVNIFNRLLKVVPQVTKNICRSCITEKCSQIRQDGTLP